MSTFSSVFGWGWENNYHCILDVVNTGYRVGRAGEKGVWAQMVIQGKQIGYLSKLTVNPTYVR